MEHLTKFHLLTVIACVTRVCFEREKVLRALFLKVRRLELKLVPIASLLRRLRSILLRCGPGTLKYLYARGLFNRSELADLFIEVLVRKGLDRDRRFYHVMARSEVDKMMHDSEGDRFIKRVDLRLVEMMEDTEGDAAIEAAEYSWSGNRSPTVSEVPDPLNVGGMVDMVNDFDGDAAVAAAEYVWSGNRSPSVSEDPIQLNDDGGVDMMDDTDGDAAIGAAHYEWPTFRSSSIFSDAPDLMGSDGWDNVFRALRYTDDLDDEDVLRHDEMPNDRLWLENFLNNDSIDEELAVLLGQGGGTSSRTVQVGGGVAGEDIRPRFIVSHRRQRTYRRFRMEGVEIVGSIPRPPPGQDIYRWMQLSITDLHRSLSAERDPEDFIGITIQSDRFAHGPLWLSFRPVRDFAADDLWSMLFRAAQSADSFDIDDNFKITCAVVESMRGGRRVRMNEENVSKKSILSIRNDDNLCLPRALVTATVYAERGQIRTGPLHEHWNRIRHSSSLIQTVKARTLTRDAGVLIPPEGCGLHELARFQSFYAPRGIAIVVYGSRGFGRGELPLYDGTDVVLNSNQVVRVTVRILYYEDRRHYDPILNLTGATGSRGYCIPCNRSYFHEEDHRCSNKCSKCMHAPPCEKTVITRTCPVCRREFYGDNCFENHRRRNSFRGTSTVCASIYICNRCFKAVRHTYRGKRHECGVAFCDVCKERRPVNHHCFLHPIAHNVEQPKVIYLFYDFETQQSALMPGAVDVFEHVVNLCVVHQVCTYCLDDNDITNVCHHCGIREYVFRDDPVKELVDLALTVRNDFSRTVCIAHNSQGFDGQFVLKYILEKYNHREKPTVILNGTKIILLELMHAKFIDSLNYFHMSLASLPKAYGLPNMAKGTFPHLFNRPENQNYIGPLPPVETYAPDTIMNEKDRQKFFEWHAKLVSENYIFNFREEIVKYCKQDVTILRLACLAFRATFIRSNVDPFVECTTIASSCLRVFRKNYLKKDQIGIVPQGGYRGADNQSRKALQWLHWMDQRVLNRRIEHAGRTRERRLPAGFQVDGFCDPLNEEDGRGVVLQFHGCYWHGCPRCYRVNRHHSTTNGESMDSRYERTCAISSTIRLAGYRLIEMWECDFSREMTRNDAMRDFINTNGDTFDRKVLNPRDAFFGGRTGNTVKMYECRPGERIRYVDVCSLYPYICKRGQYPIGHPKLYVGAEECRDLTGPDNNIVNVDGLISCEVLPPRNLYHPVLPVRMHGKLLFPLCRSCCELKYQDECPHNNIEDRILQGTWVSIELRRAVELGYIIKSIHEIWQYETTQYDQLTGQGGLFPAYINEFFKHKVQASGFPPNCINEEQKDQFIREIEQAEGIHLNRADIGFNAGLRSVAKLCLNSLWGKLAEQLNKQKTEIVKDPARLTELLTSPDIEVNTILPINDETLCVGWVFNENSLPPGRSTSVVTAAFTTAQARLKLFEYLHALGQRVLYYDTDSVFYVSRDGDEDLPIGTMLGDLTDELADYGEGTYISNFVSGGPKFYAYEYVKPDGTRNYQCKVKGIRLDYANQQLINFDSIKSMVSGVNDKIETSSSVIRRTKFHDVVSFVDKKVCKPVFSKRIFIGLHRSIPYGYKS